MTTEAKTTEHGSSDLDELFGEFDELLGIAKPGEGEGESNESKSKSDKGGDLPDLGKTPEEEGEETEEETAEEAGEGEEEELEEEEDDKIGEELDQVKKELEATKARESALMELIRGRKTDAKEDDGDDSEAEVKSYGVEYTLPELDQARFEEALTDPKEFMKLIGEVASGAASVQGQNSLLEMDTRIQRQISSQLEVTRFFRSTDGRDLLKGREWILTRAAQIHTDNPSRTIEENLTDAGNELRGLLRTVGGSDPAVSKSRVKRGKFAKGTRKAPRKAAPEKLSKEEQQFIDDFDEMKSAK